MNREEIKQNVGATVTLNGFGDLAMEPQYRKYSDDCIGNYPLIIKKLTRGGMAHLYCATTARFITAPPKNVDMIVLAMDIVVDGITWHPVSSPPKKEYGWFMGAVLPCDHKERTRPEIHRWQNEFGTEKVWYNADACYKWFKTARAASVSLEGLITHWAELPCCPLFGE